MGAGPGTGTSDQSDVMEGDRTDQSRRLSLHLDLGCEDVASLSSLSAQSKMKNFKKLWEESLHHSKQLALQLSDTKSELETVQAQLEDVAIQAVNQKAATQNEKTEKMTVIQKLEEAEQELKVIIVQKIKFLF